MEEERLRGETEGRNTHDRVRKGARKGQGEQPNTNTERLRVDESNSHRTQQMLYKTGADLLLLYRGCDEIPFGHGHCCVEPRPALLPPTRQVLESRRVGK